MNMNYGCAVNTITEINTITSEVVGGVVKNRACLSSLHISSLARFLDLTARKLSRGVSVGRMEALVFLLWQSSKVGSGFSAPGISSTKCRLQTLESLLGIQRVTFKLFLLIFLPIVIGVQGSSFLSGTGIIRMVAGSHTCLNHCYNHIWSSQVMAAHFLSLCPLLGQPRITLFR